MAITRINQLPDGSGSLTNDDTFLFMDDPSGDGVTKKISLSEISNAIGGLVSDPSGITGASAITNIVQISQNDYDNLPSYDPNTVYIINT